MSVSDKVLRKSGRTSLRAVLESEFPWYFNFSWTIKTCQTGRVRVVLPVLVDEESVSCYPLGMHTSSELLASTCRAFVSLSVELVCFGVLLASNASLLKAACSVARAICHHCCCLV